MKLSNDKLKKCFIAMAKGDDAYVDKVLAKLSASERKKKAKKNKGKNEKRDKITKTKWKDLDVMKKAKFIATYEWDSKSHKWKKKENKGDVKSIKKDLIRKSKLMKRKGKQISKKGSKVKRVSSAVIDNLKVLLTDLSNYDEHTELLAMLLSKTKRNILKMEVMNELNKIFARPESVTMYKNKNNFAIVVDEGMGNYTFIGNESFIKQIDSGMKKHLKTYGITPDTSIKPLNYFGKDFVETIKKL